MLSFLLHNLPLMWSKGLIHSLPQLYCQRIKLYSRITLPPCTGSQSSQHSFVLLNSDIMQNQALPAVFLQSYRSDMGQTHISNWHIYFYESVPWSTWNSCVVVSPPWKPGLLFPECLPFSDKKEDCLKMWLWNALPDFWGIFKCGIKTSMHKRNWQEAVVPWGMMATEGITQVLCGVTWETSQEDVILFSFSPPCCQVSNQIQM